MKTLTIAALATAALTAPLSVAPSQAVAQDRTITLGFSGLMDRRNRTTLPPITLSVGKPLAEAPLELLSGGFYQIEIIADGTGEIGLSGPGFFRNIWINEVVINDLETRPIGMDSFEFDAAGTIEMSFIAIRPGTYELRVPGTSGDLQALAVTIR